jgi:hypothetical protein
MFFFGVPSLFLGLQDLKNSLSAGKSLIGA